MGAGSIVQQPPAGTKSLRRYLRRNSGLATGQRSRTVPTAPVALFPNPIVAEEVLDRLVSSPR